MYNTSAVIEAKLALPSRNRTGQFPWGPDVLPSVPVSTVMCMHRARCALARLPPCVGWWASMWWPWQGRWSPLELPTHPAAHDVLGLRRQPVAVVAHQAVADTVVAHPPVVRRQAGRALRTRRRPPSFTTTTSRLRLRPRHHLRRLRRSSSLSDQTAKLLGESLVANRRSAARCRRPSSA